jgi:hypothetical protein
MLDTPVRSFAHAWGACFVDVGKKTVAQLAPKLVRKAEPTVRLSFNVADERAVALMQNRQSI